MKGERPKLRGAAVSAVVYALAAVIFSFPAVLAGPERIVGRNFDALGTVWVLHAAPRLLAGGLDPLTGWPAGAPVGRLDSWTLLPAGALFSWMDPARLHGALAIVGLAVSAFAAERAAVGLGARPPWSLIAGFCFAFSGLSATALLEGHSYLLLDPWLPLLGWAWWRCGRPEARPAHGLAAGLGFAGALFTSGYLGVVGALYVVVVGAAALWRRQLSACGALAALAVALPAAVLYLILAEGGPGYAAPGEWVDAVDRLAGGSAGSLQWGPPTAGIDLRDHSASVFLPFTALSLVGVAPRVLGRLPGWRALVAAGLLFALLSLGPLWWLGPLGAFTAPTAALAELPGAGAVRFPARLAWGAALCVGLVAARVATALAEGGAWRAAPLGIALLVDVFVVGGMPARLGGFPGGAPSLYSGRGAVLDLAPESLGDLDEVAALSTSLGCAFQASHGRPLPGFCPYRRDDRRFGEQRALLSALEGSPAGLLDALRARQIATVVLWADLFQAPDRRRLEDALLTVDPNPVVSRSHGLYLRAYQVPPAVQP